MVEEQGMGMRKPNLILHPAKESLLIDLHGKASFWDPKVFSMYAARRILHFGSDHNPGISMGIVLGIPHDTNNCGSIPKKKITPYFLCSVFLIVWFAFLQGEEPITGDSF